MTFRILLADEQRIVREGLHALLEKEQGMQVVSEVGDGKSVLSQAEERLPDIIMMDLVMPDMDGIQLIRRITGKFPSIKVIALTNHSNRVFVTNAFEAGARGYVLKECTFAEVRDAINMVMDGEIYLSPMLAGVVIAGQIDRPIIVNGVPVLTDRETEVLRRLAAGQSSKEIAIDINKSVQTIDACRREIMLKLGIGNIPGLVKYAIRQGLATL